jgi:hypothetical protein
VATGGLPFDSPVSLNMAAAETGLYKLVLMTKKLSQNRRDCR